MVLLGFIGSDRLVSLRPITNARLGCSQSCVLATIAWAGWLAGCGRAELRFPVSFACEPKNLSLLMIATGRLGAGIHEGRVFVWSGSDLGLNSPVSW